MEKGQRERTTKTDCFAYETDNGSEWCSALNGLYCRYNTCLFYKHRDEVKAEKVTTL